MPVLMAKISEKRYQTAYRKAYSTLNQALRSMLDDGYVINLRYSDIPIEENFKILSNYFAGATKCFDGNADKCWECDKGQSGYGRDRGCNEQMPAFIDASGMAYYLYQSYEGDILVDINGFSGPNELGKDRYFLFFTNSLKKSKYSDDVDTIYPWPDITVSQTMCPSGDCPNTSRLFGDRSQTIDYRMDVPI